MKKTCIIVGAGAFDGLLSLPKEDELLIAADGGYRYLIDMGLAPNILIGDFDSLDIRPEHQRLICHSPIKDDTDMALAVGYAVQQGYSRFLLYGGLGKRLDHTIANIQLLTGMSKRGLEAYLIGEGNILTVLTDGAIDFRSVETGTVSVFSLGEQAKRVTETGLKYSLDNDVLTYTNTRGVSNEFIGKESRIYVEDGALLIIWESSNGLDLVKQREVAAKTNAEQGFLTTLGWKMMETEEIHE